MGEGRCARTHARTHANARIRIGVVFVWQMARGCRLPIQKCMEVVKVVNSNCSSHTSLTRLIKRFPNRGYQRKKIFRLGKGDVSGPRRAGGPSRLPRLLLDRSAKWEKF